MGANETVNRVRKRSLNVAENGFSFVMNLFSRHRATRRSRRQFTARLDA
jgi:hypothetical protein